MVQQAYEILTHKYFRPGLYLGGSKAPGIPELTTKIQIFLSETSSGNGEVVCGMATGSGVTDDGLIKTQFIW